MVAPSSTPDMAYLTDTLPTLISPIFQQVQLTTANHRKNLVALLKIHTHCAKYTEKTPKGTKLTGEKQFNAVFTDMVNRVLSVKKGVAVADRVVKFVALYVAYCTEQDADKGEDSEEETTASRFVTKLLKHLLSGMEAKDKNVRFRVTLLTVSMINGLGEMDDDLYVNLRRCLLDRSRDKDTAVRVQAALGLAKLQDGEDEEDLQEGDESLAQVLLDLLIYDPAAEVRRAALYNLPRTPANMPFILARTRDIDPVLRRTVYHGSLSSAALPDARVLSIAQREDVVKNGLGDREGNVRKATAGMLGGWFDQAGCDVIEFLSRFDVVSSMVAEDALSSLFTTRQEVYHSIEFDDEFWADLTPEKAFLARVFVDHCISTKDNIRLEDSLPVVTHFAFHIQDRYNSLVQANEDELLEKTFIVGELLKLAVNLDYADENGRRQMFSLTRDMLKEPNLPESLIPGCLDILCKISNNERDFIRVVVEDVITDLREGEVEEDTENMDSHASTYSTTPARRKGSSQRALADDPDARLKAALTDLRCLMICISLLERVNSALQDNSVFHGLLPDLIIPAVQNKEEPALREQGLVCLGLCCMLDAKMARESIGLFISQIAVGETDLRVRVMRIIMDLLMVHDVTGLVPGEKSVGLIPHFLQQEDPDVQAVAVEGVAKMMLAGMISDVETLQSLVLLYFDGETAENQPLRQCLAYFLPVYCYSSSENQRRMLSIFSETFSILSEVFDAESAESDMPPLAQMGLMIVDWLDPEKTVERDGVKADTSIHLDLAIEIGKSLLSERSKDVRKALVSFILKLNLPEASEVEAIKVQILAYLFAGVRTKRPMAETSSRNALVKFDALLSKRYAEHLEGFDEETFAADEREQVREAVSAVEDAETREDSPSEIDSHRRGSSTAPKAKRGSRAGSRATSVAETSADEDEVHAPPPKRPKRGAMKVVEEEEEEDEDEDEEDEEEEDVDMDAEEQGGDDDEIDEDDVDMEAAAMAEEEGDEEDEEDEDEEAEPTPKPKSKSISRSKAPPRAKAPVKKASAKEKETKAKSSSKAKAKAKAPVKVKGKGKARTPESDEEAGESDSNSVLSEDPL